MPQMDKLTYLSQNLWIFLLSFYFYLFLIFIYFLKFISIKKIKIYIFNIVINIFFSFNLDLSLFALYNKIII